MWISRGLGLIVLGVVGYMSNALLIKHFIEKRVPGLFDLDLKINQMIGPPKEDSKYLWEHTAGSGIVPRWVSLIGLAAVVLLMLGCALVAVSLLIRLFR